jgi:tetratricopeptide (TPR) repeat protein
MYLRSTFLTLLLLLPRAHFQVAGDSFRKHYEAAEAARRAGNLAAAEVEYTKILAGAYPALGRIYTAQANYQAAVASLESAAALRPDATDALVPLSIAYFYAGQYKQAAEPLTRALARDPRNAPARHMLGKTHFMLGDYAAAARELEAALVLAPTDYDAAYTLGLAYLKQRQFDAARRVYERFVAALGDRPQLRVLTGRAYRETGFLPEAIAEFKKAAALDPRFPRVHYHLGLTYLLKDGAAAISDAARELQMELAAHPEEFLANYYLGVIHASEGRWEQASGLLEKASRLQPQNPDPFFFLGQAYQNSAKYEQAIRAFQQTIRLNPSLEHNDYQVTNAHFRLGQSLLKAGRTAEGERELQLAAELKSKAFKTDEAKLDAFLKTKGADEQNNLPELVTAQNVVAGTDAAEARTREALKTDAAFYEKILAAAHNNIGLLRAERQDFRAAADHFEAAAKLNPHHEGLDYNLGLAHYKSESYKKAIAPLEREVQARPVNLQAKQLLGLSSFMTEDYARAAALLTEVVAARPGDVTLYYPLALALGKLGRTAEADRITRQMVALGGNSPQVHILLGRAHYEQNDTPKALEELRAALALDASVRLAHFYSGLIYVKTGKLDEAAREFEAELKLNPADIQARYHLAYVALARQETERGIRLMREVIRDQPDFANARFELGNALLKQGDTRGAVESLEAAARLAPGQAHIHYQLGRALIAAGRQAEGEGQLNIARQLKDKSLQRATNP